MDRAAQRLAETEFQRASRHLEPLPVFNGDVLDPWFDTLRPQWMAHHVACSTDREAAVSTALEISERARRHVFFSSLALGGRLHALRWLLECPPETLDKKAAVQRQELPVGTRPAAL